MTPFRRRALTFVLVVGAYLLGTSHAQDTGTPPPVRITPTVTETVESLPPLGTGRSAVRQQLHYVCGVLTGQPVVIEADAREPFHGRTGSGGCGPENDSHQRGEL